MSTVFAKKIYTHSCILENQVIITDKGIISSVSPGVPSEFMPTVDCLSAAFIDLQVNGGMGLNFTEYPNLLTIQDISKSCAEVGTGFTLPTLLSSPLENILKAIEAIKNFQQKFPEQGVLGMHLEGPFINPEKRGAHALSWVRKPTTAELEEIIRYGKGVIRLMTVAPEVFTAAQLDILVSSGIIISAGHSNATYQEAVKGFSRGIKLVTHLYNAMSSFMPREPGLVGAAFDTSFVATPMILDGLHSDYAAARLAYKVKRDQLFLISDALFVGEKKQTYKWGDFNAHLEGDKYINDEGHFAGSTIALGNAVHNAVYHVGISLPEAIEMVTTRPAKAIGMEESIGRVQPGYKAVFTVFNNRLDQFEVLRFN